MLYPEDIGVIDSANKIITENPSRFEKYRFLAAEYKWDRGNHIGSQNLRDWIRWWLSNSRPCLSVPEQSVLNHRYSAKAAAETIISRSEILRSNHNVIGRRLANIFWVNLILKQRSEFIISGRHKYRLDGLDFHPCSLVYARSVDGRFGKIVRVISARDHFIQSEEPNASQYNSEDSYPNRSIGSSPSRLVCGCLMFVLGFVFMKLAFYIADAPYGAHWWGSRSLYVGCGFLSVVCIWQSINLTMGFIVARKHLHSYYFSYYTNPMPNTLSSDKQIAIISSLCEGSSIRSVERITGVHRDTIMRLGVKVGKGCTTLLDAKMRNLSCARLEMDEIWGFVGKKEKHLRRGDDPQFGNVWTFCAIDAETKLVPAFRVGNNRDVQTATAFVLDVADRMKNRVQISTDGLRAYVDAIDWAFGGNVDYGQIVKTYGTEESVEAQRRYSAPTITGIEKKEVFGRPEFDLISTSYIERLNATTRLHMKRLARLTHAFSKKRENFEAAVGLHFAYYNFVRRHNTLRCTPAMAAGVEQSFWSVGDLVEATA
jgi:IS1 family transposase